MLKDNKDIYKDASLLKKTLLDDAEEEDCGQLRQLLKERPELQEVYERLRNSKDVQETFDDYRKFDWEDAYRKFLQQVGGDETDKQQRFRFRRWGKYAAVVALLLTVCAGIYMMNDSQDADKLTDVSVEQTVILPGSKQGMLKLTDGSVIDINEKKLDWVVEDIHVKYERGVLSYSQEKTENRKRQAGTSSSDFVSNELTTPRGGENTVILSDGTVIHLNAGSKLIYPVCFSGKYRRVRLEGEAYFDVAKDEQHPFIVQTRLGDISVQGTSFNVNVYEKTGKCYTTLVEGKVSFSCGEDHSVALLPGEQLVVSSDEVEKRKVDIDEYIGWVKGEYVFTDKPLREIMQSFEQWYDIQVEYEKPELCELTYSGSLKRDKSVNAFLSALELIGDVGYEIKGKNILIYEKK